MIKKTITLSLFFLSVFNVHSADAVLTSSDTMIFVLGTDNNYVEPTAVTIKTVQSTTPGQKTFILFADHVEKQNINKLQLMMSSSDELMVIDLSNSKYSKYISFMDKYKTAWNRLVALRIVYSDILKNELVQGKHIDKFLHLDSDLYVMKNQREFWNLSAPENSPLLGADTQFISSDNLKWMSDNSTVRCKLMGGGVILWDLKRVLELFNQESGYKNLFCEELEKQTQIIRYDADDDTLELWDLLIAEKKEGKTITEERILTSPQMDRLDQKYSKYVERTEATKRILTEIYNDKSIYFVIDRNYLKWNLSNYVATEEECFINYGYIVDTKYNFLVKYIYPELDKTPKDLFDAVAKFAGINCCNYTELLHGMLQYESVRTELANSLKDVNILHFDVTMKPWSSEADSKKYPVFQYYHDILETTPFHKKESITPMTSEQYFVKSALLVRQVNADFKSQMRKVMSDVIWKYFEGSLSFVKMVKKDSEIFEAFTESSYYALGPSLSAIFSDIM